MSLKRGTCGANHRWQVGAPHRTTGQQRRSDDSRLGSDRPSTWVTASLGKKAMCASAAFRFHRNQSLWHNWLNKPANAMFQKNSRFRRPCLGPTWDWRALRSPFRPRPVVVEAKNGAPVDDARHQTPNRCDRIPVWRSRGSGPGDQDDGALRFHKGRRNASTLMPWRRR